MADWEEGAEEGERQRNVSAGRERTKGMEDWMDQHLVGGRGGPSLSTGRGGSAWRTRGTRTSRQSVHLFVSTSSHRGRIFPFSAVSIKFTISKNYFKNKQEIFNERAP